MISKFYSIHFIVALLANGASAAKTPPSGPEDLSYLAALTETTYCSKNEYTSPGLKVANATLLKSLPFSELDAQRVDVYHDPTYGIVVAYQGTNSTSWIDWLHDIDFIPPALPDEDLGLPFGSLLHHGFLNQYRDSWPSVNETVNAVLQDYPDSQLTVIGHSMGASIAQLGALALQNTYGNVERVVGFAPPRVGNLIYAGAFNEVFNDKYTGVWNGQDWVPTLPRFEWGFSHPNNMVWISPENSTTFQYFEHSEDWSGPAGKLPRLVSVESATTGISQLINTVSKGDLYDAISAIFNIIYLGAHDGIYFQTEIYGASAAVDNYSGCPGKVGGH